MADIGSTLTNFLTQMVALSVAAERVTETIKQFTLSAPADIQAAAKRSWIVQTIAIVTGIVVVALSGLNPVNMPNFAAFDIGKDWGCWLVTGILVSGGSAFWNHLLDILKATKVQKEAAAGSTAGATPITP